MYYILYILYVYTILAYTICFYTTIYIYIYTIPYGLNSALRMV